MAHTTKIPTEYGEVTFIHNSDMSGDITIISDSGEQANIPFEAIVGFYASFVRQQKVAELDEMSDEEILKLSQNCDYCVCKLSGGGYVTAYGRFCSRQCSQGFEEEAEEELMKRRVRAYSGVDTQGSLTDIIVAATLHIFETQCFGHISAEEALDKIVNNSGVHDECYDREQVLSRVEAKFIEKQILIK